jgi:hypothetical protein
MAVTAANFKLYRCATNWGVSGGTQGGAISATEIQSSGDQVIFDDVTNDERVAGLTEYRKIFFKNCSPNDSVSIKVYISTQSSLQPISIVAASGSDVESTADDYTYVQPVSLGTGVDLGTLAADASAGLWIKRVITAGANGATADQFALTFGMY